MKSAAEVKTLAHEKQQNVRRAFQSWQGFKDWVQVSDTALDEVRGPCTPYWQSNADGRCSMVIPSVDLRGLTKILTRRKYSPSVFRAILACPRGLHVRRSRKYVDASAHTYITGRCLNVRGHGTTVSLLLYPARCVTCVDS